ncbi:protein BREAST CANCER SUSCEPTIBILITY 2 homolog A isoform X2 [Medicago truncatula]|uniref:protein BREAST CANCER SUSCEPTIBILITY 2 homolog A isoform X2 n=1 Tax=Medicago truncatula TaxID=3880 RepID=UPI000D2F3BCE|nr:protein BREAST CANCER SUSCEPTIBILITY 2 homolog A isoform X2 [Medicago truncatula]
MSSWQILPDADNNYRWQINSDDTSNVIPPSPPPFSIPTPPLPSMYDLLIHASASHLFQPQEEENAIDDSFGFANSLFKTGSGRKVTISSKGLVRAKTLLGLGLHEETVGANIQTPQNAKKFNSFHQDEPRLQVIDSCKKTSAASFQSPLVSRLKNGFENKIVQPDTGSRSGVGAKQAPIKFQTGVSNIQAPQTQNASFFDAFDEELPDLQLMDSCKKMSAASFQSPLVGRLHMGSENKVAQLDSGSVSGGKDAPLTNSLFKTGSGRKVTISSKGLVRAKTLLGLGLHEETVGANIQTPQNAEKLHAFDEELPHVQLMDSCKMMSSASFQSPLVGRLKNGFESKFVQPDSGGGAKQAPIKFQTASGRSLSISGDALKRARRLLGDPDLGDFFDGGDSLFSFLDQGQTSTITSSAERSESKNTHTPLVHQMTPENHPNHMSKSFTYPLQPSKQMEFSNKLRNEGNGNNLIVKFDDVVNESDCGCKSSITPGQKPLYNKNEVADTTIKSSSLNGFSSRMDSREKPLGRALVDISNTIKTVHTNHKQPASGKRRIGLHATVSSFKKPRISNISASGGQDVQYFSNDLAQLSSGASGFKRKVSTRYPFHHPRMYIKDYFAVPPLEQKVNFPNPARQVTSCNAGAYIFHDGSDSNDMGAEAFIHLLTQHGASLRFASKEWVLNHYKWIVWKLACYERCYPARCAGKFLTVSNVLEELKYRYEREVNHGHRSTIKKILEGDGLPSSMMTLCISSIHSDHVLDSGALSEPQTGNQSNEALKVELTDGWYSINAILDVPLSKQLAAGRLFVGQKLRIWGAGLCGWNGPVSPLEVSSTVSLLLHINGTYRAHWADRLGLCKVAGPPLAFKCIKRNGGLVPQTLAGITRIYPILYKERLSSGRSVVISERMENKMMELHNQRRSAVVDNIVSEYQKEMTGSHIYDYGNSEGAKIYKMLETAAEPEFLMADMTPEQLSSFAAYKAKLNANRQSQMESSIEKALKDSGLGDREVTPFMRLRVVGLTYKNQRDKPTEGIVTIWNPTQKQRQELSEGEAYAIAELIPSGSDSDVLHLQTRGSTTKWLPLSSNAKEQFKPFSNNRNSIPLSSLSDIPLSNEFDVVAFVVHVGKVYTSSQQKKQWVFVTDGSIMNGLQSQKVTDTLLAICFCSPLFDHDSFPPINHNLAGSTVGFCNLIKKEKDHTNHIWVADANEISTYYLKFDSPQCSHLRNAASSVRRWASNSSLIIEKLKEKVLGIVGDCKA